MLRQALWLHPREEEEEEGGEGEEGAVPQQVQGQEHDYERG